MFDRDAFETFARRAGLVMDGDRCFVYVMKSGIFHKVGIATNVAVRRERLQMASPFEVKVMRTYGMGDRHWARTVERAVHDDLAEFRVHGEWFKVGLEEVTEAVEFFVREARRLRKERNAKLKAEYAALWHRYLTDKAFKAEVDETAY